MNLRVEKVSGSKSKAEVKAIYQSSFAKEERMPFGMMVAMSYLWNTDFLAFYDADRLCGFVYLAKMGKLVFILFFAVNEALRGKGYGSQILNQLRDMHAGKKIVVSIEPLDQGTPNLAQRIRRKKFYLKNGFNETGYFLKLGSEQEILISNGTFDKGEFARFFMLYSNFTMYPKIWKK